MRGADGNPHQVRLDDARAVELAGRGPVSMGMSADFEAAIAAGANLVRIGTAIFGTRG